MHWRRSERPGGSGQRIKDISPDPLTAPAIEAIVDRRVRPIDFRTITPARPTSQHVNNPADHAAIIDPMSPFAQTQREWGLQALGVVIRQAEDFGWTLNRNGKGSISSHANRLVGKFDPRVLRHPRSPNQKILAQRLIDKPLETKPFRSQRNNLTSQL